MKRARALVAALLASSVAAAALAADEATPATEKKQRALSTQLQTRTGDFDVDREIVHYENGKPAAAATVTPIRPTAEGGRGSVTNAMMTAVNTAT